MNLSKQLATQLRLIYNGGNWTASSLREQLADLSWGHALVQIEKYNTIATLVYHIHYYVRITSEVLDGKPLNGKDELSFNHPPITSQKEWSDFIQTVAKETEAFAVQIEQLPEERLWETFSEEKHGTYYRNIQGIIEHSYYHLGQIAMLKKLIQSKSL